MITNNHSNDKDENNNNDDNIRSSRNGCDTYYIYNLEDRFLKGKLEFLLWQQ